MVTSNEGPRPELAEAAFEGDTAPLAVAIGEELRTACTDGLAAAVDSQKLPMLTRLATATMMESEHTEMVLEVERVLLWSIDEVEPEDVERQDGIMALFGIGDRWGRFGLHSLNERRDFAARSLGYAGALLLNQRGEGEERRIFRALRTPLTVLAVQHDIRC